MSERLALLRLMRPIQWLKNLMLFFPVFLGGKILQADLMSGIVPFSGFCLLSSGSYVLNDLMDASQDALHPHKKNRPLASGQVRKRNAVILFAVLLASGGYAAASVTPKFFILALLYLGISILYSLVLKNLAVIDMFCIAAGFILRLQAGGAAFHIYISEWLFVTVFLLSIFLATGKRLSEKRLLQDDASAHRRSLLAYPPVFLEAAMCLTGGAVLVTYSMYLISKNSPVLFYTVPLCCFGLLRYLFRVLAGSGGDPTEALVKDFPLLATGIVWTAMIAWSIYG